MALLTHRRDIRANLAKDFCSPERAKTARDFLLDFHHSDISFRQVIIKRHAEIIHKGERFFTIMAEPIEQVFSLRLFLAPSLHFVRKLRWSISSKPFSQDSLIAPLKFSNIEFIKATLARLTNIINSFFNLEQVINHFICPTQAILLRKKSQLSQMMGIAQSMPASVISV